MMVLNSRARLLAGAALGLGVSALAPQQAMAACTYAGGDYTCTGTTTTTDTIYPANVPLDRTITFPAGPASNVILDVTSGAVVNGYGLALTTVGTVGPDLHVHNNGTVTVNAGNTPVTGGSSAAISIVSAGTDITYDGAGDAINLGTGPGIFASTTGTGTINLNIGGSVRAENGHAVLVSGLDGDITVTTTAGETIRASTGSGLNVGSFGTGNIAISNAANISSGTTAPINTGILALGFGTGNVAVANTGAIGTSTDRASGGIFAAIANAASAGSVGVSGSGAIFAINTGITATTSGTGAVTVNYSGPINTTGTTGVDVNATTGTATVTLGAVTAATNAVDVTSTGAQTITLNGVTTGTAGSGLVSDTTGARTITVGAAGNVTGGTQAILLNNTGATTMTVAAGGTVGSGATGLAINDAGGGVQTITNNGTLNGLVTLGAGADTLTNAGTMNVNGVLDFGADADRFVNTGTLNVLGNSSFVGLENFGTGTTQANAGRINISAGVTLTGPAVAFTNAGTIDTAGNATLAGITSFSNSGTLDLAPGTFTVPAAVFTNTGTVIADEGASTITGQTSFANSGTIDLSDGATGDVLTINSAFAGTGGSNLDVDFSGTAADRLVIVGAASGSTAVDANFVGGGLINLDGVQVVDATTATANAFVLGSVTGSSPLVDVSLLQTGGDFFLISAPNASAFDPLAVPLVSQSLWYQSADEVLAETHKPATTVGFSIWGDGYYSQDDVDGEDDFVVDGTSFDVDQDMETKRYGVQLGVDYGFGGGRIGLTGGYAWANSDNDGNLSDIGLDTKGWNIGVYGQFGGVTGFHGEILFKHDRYDAEFDDGLFDGEEFDVTSTGIDGAIGYRFGIGGDANLDLSAGLSHVWSKIDDVDAFGFDYDIGKLTSTRGRAGLRAVFGGSLAPYVDATVYREFDGDGDVEMFDGANTFDLDTNGKGTWVRLEAGLSGNDGPGPILAAWGDLGDKQGFGIRAGWRFGGGTAEALPPPPPPPPPAPPAPATQTCADGSVILATDACPPPPPPPPPPPVERGERG